MITICATAAAPRRPFRKWLRVFEARPSIPTLFGRGAENYRGKQRYDPPDVVRGKPKHTHDRSWYATTGTWRLKNRPFDSAPKTLATPGGTFE
jgi:hypothetical protein